MGQRYVRDSQHPYRPPRVRERNRTGKTKRGLLWWCLLALPYLALALAFSSAYVWIRLDMAGSERLRATVICFGSGLASGSVTALFTFPAAWMLERILHRLRSGPDRFQHVALKLLTMALYLNATVWISESCGYVSRDEPAFETISVVTAAVDLSFVPLLVVWAAVAVRQRRR